MIYYAVLCSDLTWKKLSGTNNIQLPTEWNELYILIKGLSVQLPLYLPKEAVTALGSNSLGGGYTLNTTSYGQGYILINDNVITGYGWVNGNQVTVTLYAYYR